MKSFKTFITEAKFKSSQIQKVAKNIQRIFSRKMGKLYRWGGPNGFLEMRSKGKRYSGLLLIKRDHEALQFNFLTSGKSVTIETISVWRKFKFGQPADMTIDVSQMNIVQVVKNADKLIDIIKSHKAGKYELDLTEEEYFEDSDILLEAKRVPLETFREAALKFLGKDKELSRDEIKQVAIAAGYQQPNIDKLEKPRRGRFNLYWDENKANSGEKKHKVYITVRNADTNKFEFPQFEKAEKILKAAIEKVKKQEPSKKEMMDPNTLFGRLYKLVKFVACGKGKSLFIYGGAGTGKTTTVKQAVADCGLTPGKDWVLIKGKITPASLYRTLFLNKNKDKVLVFDDSDSVFEGQDAANILKAALDSYDERIVSWVSNRTVNVTHLPNDEKEDLIDSIWDQLMSADPQSASSIKLPSEFKYEGKIIFISNLPLEKVDQAILSRSFKIDMTLTQEQMFQRMEGILENLGGTNTPIEDKKMILEKLRELAGAGDIGYVNMRTFVAALGLYESGLDDWYNLIEYT